MKNDAWFRRNAPINPDMVIKSEVAKIGWTDAAREAAALARQKGYNQKNDFRSSPLKFQHMNGHSLHISPNGEWGHVESRGGEDAKMSWGKTVGALHERLSDLHGLGTGPTSRDLSARDAQVEHDKTLASAKPNKKLSVPEAHQHRIAQQTLRMNPAMAGVMGGPDHHAARHIIAANTGLKPYAG